MTVEFTAHNIRLDDGTCTRPDAGCSLELDPWFLSAKKILETVFPGDKNRYRLADLGCLEGGFSVEFARMGFEVLGLEVREANMEACRFVESRVDLPRLQFVRDNAWNIAQYGKFDAVFCCGLFYHLEFPGKFLKILSQVTRKIVMLQTHFSTDDNSRLDRLPGWFRKQICRWRKNRGGSIHKYGLSSVTQHEGLRGRWYPEFETEEQFRNREKTKWASWDNRRSFWIQREYLLQAVREAGFDLVMEQFDGLGSNIARTILEGEYKTENRGTFIGIKTGENP
jgi:hypothetical protein